jgi:hypothetical protein
MEYSGCRDGMMKNKKKAKEVGTAVVVLHS